MQQKYVIGGVAVLILIGLVVWFSKQGVDKIHHKDDIGAVTAPTEDPVDVTLDFYQAWLETQTNSEATPSAADLLASDVISEGVRSYVTGQTDSDVEPVLCQSATPERIRAQVVSANDTAAQMQIFARGDGLTPGQYALVDLAAVNGQWQIDQIGCFSGESAPEREFTFEQSGQLLKSVPPPLNADNWHLVFMQDGQPGGVVPLFFTAESMCVSAEGVEAVCAPENFTEASRASIQGNMSEAGVDVRNLELQ